jgi:catechol 2,3-dioxygenase-like lactoylglutathione lyase family enzyme
MSTETGVVFTRAIPVLASTDLDATERFYRERLGFSTVAKHPDYLLLTRDAIQVHFWLTDDPSIAENTACRIDVSGVEALHEVLDVAGVVHPAGHLRHQPWGMSEFHVVDDSGNALRFQERTPGA